MHQDNSTITVTGNTIKYYGFYYPPVGIVDILNLVFLPWDATCYIIDPILAKELPFDEIKKDPNPYVIINTNEGSSHRWFDRLIANLVDAGVKLDHIILRSACLWDPESPIKHIHTIVDECSNFVAVLKQQNINNIAPPTHHFVCLNRDHRWQRYSLVKEILDRNLDRFGEITYINVPSDADRRFASLTKPDVSWEEQRDMSMPSLTGALFNVICETSYEPEPGASQITHHHRPGMTEKSYKCFALFQIPIWLTPYRAVEFYRKLGFDVFDDIVDHSYDQEIDPEKRITMVAAQIEKLCKFDHSELVDFKSKLMDRFTHNLKVLKSYAHNFNSELPQWQVLFPYNDSY